jgi:hypothetical protein
MSRLNFQVGDRVAVEGSGCGAVAFIGEGLQDLPSGTWVGVVYDEPLGKNDGTVKGKRYFKCKPNHGHLVRPDKIRVLFAENAMAAAAGRGHGPSIGHAARSHQLNQVYMENFETAYALLQEGISDPSALHDGRHRAALQPASKCAQAPAAAGRLEVGSSSCALVEGLTRQLDVVSINAAVGASWTTGPIDPAGTLIDLRFQMRGLRPRLRVHSAQSLQPSCTA